MTKKYKIAYKVIISIAILMLISIVVYKVYKMNLGVDDIKNYVESFGKLGPIIYIIMFSLVPLTLFPDSILAISSGLIFGLVNGYIYTAIGALIGGTISFYISRKLGRNVVKKLTKEKLDKVENMINERGFFIVLMLRLIPLFPFDVISYGSGLTSIRYKDFILATFFGTIPGIFVFVNIGAQSVNIGSKSFYLSIAALILLLVVSIILKKTPNNVTILALLLGISTSIFLYFDMQIIAVTLLWVSGYLDAVDGAMARRSNSSSSFGTLLDIVSDRIVEVSIVLVLGLKFVDVRYNLIVLTVCILMSMTIFLTVGALSEKKGVKSFYYQAGVAERSEGFIFFSLMILIPSYLGIITNIFSILIIITAIQRFLEAKRLLD